MPHAPESARRVLPVTTVWSVSGSGQRRLGSYRRLLRSKEYAGLLLSRLVSLVGDQLARVALTVLVYDRTGSPLLSAGSYAASYLPAVVGGPLLGGLADRLPRRRLLVVADLLRALSFALMAVPGLPLTVLLFLVMAACAVEAPWAAARAPLMRDVLDDDEDYALGLGLDEVLSYVGQIAGFAGAGLLLVVFRPPVALLLDAGSFLVSAAVVRLTIGHRPAAAPLRDRRAARRSLGLRDAGTGWRAAMAPGCRRPLLLTWATVTCAITPEALATPWAVSLGAGPRGIGLLFAAAPVGTTFAVLAVSRVPAERAQRLLVPLAVLSLAPLALCLLQPPLPVALGLVALSGTGVSCSLLARVAFVNALSPEHRGRAFAIASAGVTGVQGVGIAGVGGLAAITSPATAVGLAGLLGLGLVAAALHVSRPAVPRGAAASPRSVGVPA